MTEPSIGSDSAIASQPVEAELEGHLAAWDFSQAAREAVGNEGLKTALLRATGKFDIGRRALMAQLPDGDLVRERARQIKDQVLADLGTYLARFADNVEAAGGHVHWAATGDQANGIVADIARERGIKRIVKSKTMVSEETRLNEVLIREGFNVVESDLGEYVLQISGDRPSHIVVPVVHRTKEEIAAVFNNALGEDLPPEPKEITALARRRLRREFAVAEMGITGANFACADTGTIVQVTNEGNGRLTTTWPRVHVVLVGIEKIIPRLDELPVFLKLLARSATGQQMTIYTNLINGPRRSAEGDGAEELHVVLIDNGRTSVLASPYRELLRCIRCGACLNACPVYRNVGGHAYGSVYPGPIGSLLTPLYDGMKRFRDLPHASSLCGACYDACPVNINIPQMLLEMRSDHTREKLTPLAERLIFRLWRLTMCAKPFYKLGGRLMRWGLAPWAKEEWLSAAPKPFDGWTDHRDIRLPASEPFHKRWKRLAEGNARATTP